jgi:hypothetical protein
VRGAVRPIRSTSGLPGRRLLWPSDRCRGARAPCDDPIARRSGERRSRRGRVPGGTQSLRGPVRRATIGGCTALSRLLTMVGISFCGRGRRSRRLTSGARAGPDFGRSRRVHRSSSSSNARTTRSAGSVCSRELTDFRSGGRELRLPESEDLRPDSVVLSWHEAEVFLGQ